MGFFLVLKAEFVRSLIIMRRYWFATAIGLVVTASILIGAATGLSKMGTEILKEGGGQGAFETILGFLIGAFAVGIVGLFTQRLQGMARTGELEQVCMSPHGLVTNFLARSFVSSVQGLITSAILVFMIAGAFAGQNLHLEHPPTILLVLLLTYINLLGFGFMMGGLVLVFKQTGQVAMLVRIGLVLIAIGSDKVRDAAPAVQAVAHLIPITDAAICIKYVLVEGQAQGPVYQQPHFYALIVSCAVWTAIGITCFRFLENWSRDKGTLGAY